jgi:hypothetical protein
LALGRFSKGRRFRQKLQATDLPVRMAPNVKFPGMLFFIGLEAIFGAKWRIGGRNLRP